MLDMECFTCLNLALESSLLSNVMFATKHGTCNIRFAQLDPHLKVMKVCMPLYLSSDIALYGYYRVKQKKLLLLWCRGIDTSSLHGILVDLLDHVVSHGVRV